MCPNPVIWTTPRLRDGPQLTMAIHFRATARRLSYLCARHPRLVILLGAAADRRSLRLARWVSPPLCGPSRSSRDARPRRWDVCDARPRRSSPFPSGGGHDYGRGRGRTSRTRCRGRRPWRPRRCRRPRRSAPRGPPRLSIATVRRWQLAPRERAMRRSASTLRRRTREI